jgi:hypothetical protein
MFDRPALSPSSGSISSQGNNNLARINVYKLLAAAKYKRGI